MTETLSLPTAAHPTAGRREQFATRAVFLAAGTAMSTWAPLVPFAKDRLGASEGTLGLLFLCLGLGSITAMPVTGVLASRFGCRRVILSAVLIVALVLPMLALASTPLTLAVALAVFGASVGTTDVAMNIQAVMVEKDSGRTMMSGFHGLFSLGGILGAGAASLLLSAGVTPLTVTLLASALLILFLAFAFKGLLNYGNQDGGTSPLFVMPHGVVVTLGILCFILFLAEGAVLDWSAVFLTGSKGLTQGQAGLGYTAFALTMTAGRLTGDMVVRALGGVRIVLLGCLLSSVGLGLAVLAGNPALSLVGFALVGLGASNIVPVFFSAAGRQTAMQPSLAVAAITTMGYAGILVGPAVIGAVAQITSLTVALMALALCLGVAGVVSARTVRT